MFNIFAQNNTSFGLDISTNSLKLFEFSKSGADLAIQAYCDSPFPKGLIVNDAIADAAAFQAVVKQVLEKPQFGRVQSKYAVLSLPESKSFVRVIQIPRMSDVEAESAVPFEAENFIPLPIDQVYLDWQKIGETSDKMNILIIASPKDFVDSYIENVEKAGIKISALEVESQSCHRSLIGSSDPETVLIVDLDASRSSLIMIEDGNLQFTSSIPIAGNTFTESIARTLGVSSAKAELIKQQVGIANAAEYPNIKTSLLPVLNNLSSEIKNILKFHAEHSEKQVKKIIFAGGAAKLKNLVEFMIPEFVDMPEVALELGNPWQHLPMLKNPSLETYNALTYTTAIGLALRGVGNL